MTPAPRIELRQSQTLAMTPQLQQAIKLLALSNLEVEGFVADAIAANPLLDMGEAASPAAPEPPMADHADGTARATVLERSPVDRLIGEGRAADDRPLDIDPVATDHGRGIVDAGGSDWGEAARSAGGAAEGPAIDERGAPAATLVEHLAAQIGAMTACPRTAGIALFIAGLLDDAGYLTASLRDIAVELGVAAAEAETALALVHACEPTGVGARSLGECIALQAREADRYDPAMACLIGHLDLIGQGELARVRRLCRVDEEDFAEMLAELRGYDPKPGLAVGGSAAPPVTPDILVVARPDQGWDIALNEATLPRLIVNRGYYVELRGACGDKAARGWLSDKLADANWLVKALDQRQKTILKVAVELVRQQEGFFRHGVSRLRPLTLRTVADAIGLHESTVSRVTSNKYLMCSRGSFELKYFFTSGVAASGGEGAVSAEAVKAAIRRLIDDEDPRAILSDDAIVDLLHHRGFDLARRTVAKYREAIGIGSSVQRRRRKALVG